MALYDIQAGFTGQNGYVVTLSPQVGTDAAAAIAAAGHRILSELYPAQQATFDTERTRQLAAISAGAARDAEVAHGQAVANAVRVARAGDGNDLFVDYSPAAVRLVRRGTVVQIDYPRVALGSYQFVIRQAQVRDRAGNPLGASNLVTNIHALTLVQDNFDGENGGNFGANYTDFANWTVTRGSVDARIADGFFYVGHGIAVDMNGTTAEAGRLESRATIDWSTHPAARATEGRG